VSKGLSAIAQTFADYVLKLALVGVDGIFYATTWASDSLMTAQEYWKLARPYDMLVLEAAIKLPFNMLHICGNRIHFEAMANYPVHAIHWDMRGELNPSLAEGKTITPCAVADGVNRKLMSGGTPDQIKAQGGRALIQARKERFLLAPSCAVDITDTPETNLLAMRATAEEGT
jgi:uroporphyrinogen decarboxylase